MYGERRMAAASVAMRWRENQLQLQRIPHANDPVLSPGNWPISVNPVFTSPASRDVRPRPANS